MHVLSRPPGLDVSSCNPSLSGTTRRDNLLTAHTSLDTPRVFLGVGVALSWERPELGQLLRQADGALRVVGGVDLADKPFVDLGRGKVVGTAQDEVIEQAAFEVPLGGFDIAVLVGAKGIDRARRGAEVLAEGEIFDIETTGVVGAFELMGDRRTEVGLDLRGDPAEAPERILQTQL